MQFWKMFGDLRKILDIFLIFFFIFHEIRRKNQWNYLSDVPKILSVKMQFESENSATLKCNYVPSSEKRVIREITPRDILVQPQFFLSLVPSARPSLVTLGLLASSTEIIIRRRYISFLFTPLFPNSQFFPPEEFSAWQKNILLHPCESAGSNKGGNKNLYLLLLLFIFWNYSTIVTNTVQNIGLIPYC